MKSLIAALVAAAVLAGAVVSYSVYINGLASDFYEYTDRVQQGIDAKDFEAAAEAARQLSDEMRKRQDFLGIIIDHSELFEMQQTVTELVCYLDDGQAAHSRASCAAAVMMIERFAGNAAPSWFNIL